jgi:hypothetical protein
VRLADKALAAVGYRDRQITPDCLASRLVEFIQGKAIKASLMKANIKPERS